MSEPTLALRLSDIRGKVGAYAGWGRGPDFNESTWDARQTAIIDDTCQSGLRRFYYPEPLANETVSHDWTFLKPTKTLQLDLNGQVVRLPDDYGQIEGMVTILNTASQTMPWRIEWRNEGQIREMYSMTPSQTGPPQYVAIQPLVGTTPEAGQRFQLFFFPQADQAYQIQFQYKLNPDYLTGATPYAYGGPQHIETILESCFAVYEERWDDKNYVHREAFKTRLAASVAMDRLTRPQHLGKNVDRSDRRPLTRSDVHWWAPAATYNGQNFN